MRKITKRTAAIAAASVIAVGAAGAAFAWSLTGTGSASAGAAGISDLSVQSAAVGIIKPGANNVTIKVNNPNKYPVRVTNAVFSASTVPAGCNAAFVTFPGSKTLPTALADVVVPAKGDNGVVGSKEILVTGAVVLNENASAECASGNYAFAVTVTANTKTTAP